MSTFCASGARACILVALTACAPSTPGPRSTLLRVVDTDSDKAVSIVEDVRFEGHEARRMPGDVVRRAMLSSGFFLPADADALAEPVAEELAGMAPSEYVRITAWADDGVRRTFVWVSGGKLRLAYFRGDLELDRYEMPIPSGQVATFVAPIDAGAPEVAPPPAAVDAGAPPAVTTPPKRRGPRCPAIAAKDATPLSEDAARRKLSELDQLLGKGLIDKQEHKCKRKEILARL